MQSLLEDSPRAGWRRFAPAAVIVLLTVLAYLPALRAGFIWDDDDYVTNNPTLRTAAGLTQIWLDPRATPQYYPLVHTSFWLEYHAWGLGPFGFHLTNILLHAGNAILFWMLLKSLRLPGAFVAAAIFAVHPVHVESVAWVTERKNVLSTFFYLAAAIVYLRSVVGESNPESSAPRHRAHILAIVLFICALLSKTVACSLPAALLLVIWCKRGRITRRDVLPLVPMFAIGFSAAIVTAWLEKYSVGADGRDFSLSMMERVLVAGRAVWFYLGKLLYPVKLTFIYPRWNVDVRSVGQWMFPIFLGGVLVVMALSRKRLGRGALVAALLFAGTLLPALGFINIYPMRYSFVADHFQYAASMGAIAAIVCSLTILARRAGLPNHLRSAACVFAITVLSVLTFRQSRVYHDLPTLWSDTIAKNPDCWMAENNLAFDLLQHGDTSGALAHANRSLQIKPDHAEAHNVLGRILAKTGDENRAIEQYTEALRIKPTLASAQINWGVLLARRGDLAGATKHFAAAATARPRNVDALMNWSTALAQQGRGEEAITLLDRVLAIRPDHPQAASMLATLRANQSDSAAASDASEIIRR